MTRINYQALPVDARPIVKDAMDRLENLENAMASVILALLELGYNPSTNHAEVLRLARSADKAMMNKKLGA